MRSKADFQAKSLGMNEKINTKPPLPDSEERVYSFIFLYSLICVYL